MIKIHFTNSRGRTIELYGAPYRLSRFDGFGDVDAGIQTQVAPYQDGETFLDTKLEARHIELELKISGKDELDFLEKRRMLTTVFNPKLGLGLLKYTDKSGSKIIHAVAESVPNLLSGNENHGPTHQKAIVYLKAPNPYWRSPQITEDPAFEPRFHFPFSGSFIMGIQRDRRIIDNTGDAPAPIQVEFFGPALNPRIINNTTGEYIKVNQQLQEGERMLIDTTDGQKSVFFVSENGERRNVFNWIDLGSSFFKLQIGENDIEYTADSDIQGREVNISYHTLYASL